MIRQLTIHIFLFSIINLIYYKIISWIPHGLFGRSRKNINSWGIDFWKVIAFELVLSGIKEITPEFETTFIKHEYFKQTLKSDYEYSDECLDFYQYFLEFENNYLSDFNKVYQCAVVKYKLKKENNEPSLSEFKSYSEMLHSKNWVEETGDELVIGDIPVSSEKKLDKKNCW